MDRDRVEGIGKDKGGKLKEKAGRALDDEKLKREGQADQVEGKIQNTVGGIKDKMREDRRDRH